MKLRLFRKQTSEHGQSLIELALILVFLIIVVAGIVDLGRALFYYVTMRDAAQEGLVYGSIYPRQCTEIEDSANATMANGGIDTGGVKVFLGYINHDITPDVPGTDCRSAAASIACTGHDIEVVVTADFPLTMPLLGNFIGTQNIKLRTSVQGTILRPLCPQQQ